MKLILIALLMAGCASTGAKTPPKKATKTTVAPKKLKTAKKTGPATQKVKDRQAAMQQEMDFTLGDPLHPAVRKRIEEERYSQTLEEMMEQETQGEE